MRNLSKIDKHNILYHFADGALFVFAMSITSIQTVIPVFIKELGASDIIVGCFPLLWGLGVNLPQIFYHPGKHLANIKHLVLRIALINRFSFLFLALIIIYLLNWLPVSGRITVVLLLLFLSAFTGSFSVPAWFHFYGKTVQTKYRGRLLAARQFAGSLLGIGGGWIIAKFIAGFSFPQNYGWLFMLTFVIMMLSYWFLRKVKEPSSSVPELSAQKGLRIAFDTLRGDRAIRNYLFSDIIAQWISTIIPFLPIYGITQFKLQQASVGYFTAMFMAGMLLANILLGIIADIKGHKINIAVYHLCVALGCLIALYAGNVLFFSLSLFVAGFTQAAIGISRIGILLEMAGEEKRRLYISIIGTFSAPFLVSGLVQGLIISLFGYTPLFIVNFVLALLGLFVVIKMVEEPRYNRLR